MLRCWPRRSRRRRRLPTRLTPKQADPGRWSRRAIAGVGGVTHDREISIMPQPSALIANVFVSPSTRTAARSSRSCHSHTRRRSCARRHRAMRQSDAPRLQIQSCTKPAPMAVRATGQSRPSRRIRSASSADIRSTAPAGCSRPGARYQAQRQRAGLLITARLLSGPSSQLRSLGSVWCIRSQPRTGPRRAGTPEIAGAPRDFP